MARQRQGNSGSGSLSTGVRRTALSFALSMCFAGAALAQSTGGLRITVSGTDGRPVAGATVKASSPDSLVSKAAVTEADGSVRLLGLDPATNYTVEVVAPGYNDFRASNVAVVSGQNLTLGYSLGATGATATDLDAVVVTGTSLAAIDTTSATVSTTLTLDIVESLPTGRDYQSYLQLVPGVSPGRNPASRSGLNYADGNGVIGTSRDNIYVLDGINVTDPLTGTFGANFNSEIIQEQQVITGGVPAEYEGGSGLISKVVTKSGSNEFHGSLNYYLQNDSLVSDNKHRTSAGFSTYDSAFTLGGPIVKDKLWFFASYQKKSREDDVLNPTTGDLQRTVQRDDEYAFLKATWQITDNDRLTATYFSDPVEISGTSTASTRNYRDSASKQGGDNYKLEYTRDWGNVLLNAYAFSHEAELSTLAADQSVRNNVLFQSGESFTYEEANIGGSGSNSETWRNRDEFGLNLEWYLDTNLGSHTFKAGYSQAENEYFTTSTVPEGATYSSLGTRHAGTTFDDLVSGSWSGTVNFTDDDRARIINGISSSSNSAALVALLDTNGSGDLSVDEISAIAFSNTTGNPGGQVNAYRALRVQDGVNVLKSKGKSLFLQDTWTLNQWTVNAGLRAEEWAHHASTGEKLFTFDWKLAPRLSVVYDLFGDGRTKVWGYFGRYYDPIRNNMTSFAGSFSGAVTEEQINIDGTWVSYRTRGGTNVIDAIFSPSTKTPYTDEFLAGLAHTIRDDVSLSFTVSKRDTKDIFEDFDLAVYSDPNGDGADGVAHPGSSLYLPYSYFGLNAEQIAAVNNGEINYVLGTLPGATREYLGYEIVLQKHRRNNWQGLVSYTYNRARGNSNSDSNADVQGDLIFLDPRAPNVWGPQPGSIEHLVKAFGSYAWDFGLELSAVFNWNSGALFTPGSLLYSRVVPPRAPAYEWEGVTSTWLEPGYVGSERSPSYYTFDVRAKYVKPLPTGRLEFFLDVFNVLDKQSATSVQNLLAGTSDYAFGEATAWVEPRRAYLGVRYSF